MFGEEEFYLDVNDGFVSGISTHFSLHHVPDCGEPDCLGHCDHDSEYEAYGRRLQAATRACKVQQAKLHGLDHEAINCTCQLCEERFVFLEDSDDLE